MATKTEPATGSAAQATRVVSVRLPETLAAALEDAALVLGDKTTSEALQAAALLYIRKAAEDEDAEREFFSRRTRLKALADAVVSDQQVDESDQDHPAEASSAEAVGAGR